MVAPHPPKTARELAKDGSVRGPDLPFRVELWDDENKTIERVIARAHSVNLAQAVFRAACEQYPGRRLSLWRGRERLTESG